MCSDRTIVCIPLWRCSAALQNAVLFLVPWSAISSVLECSTPYVDIECSTRMSTPETSRPLSLQSQDGGLDSTCSSHSVIVEEY